MTKPKPQVDRTITATILLSIVGMAISMVMAWTRVSDHVTPPPERPGVHHSLSDLDWRYISKDQYREMREDIKYIRDRLDHLIDSKED